MNVANNVINAAPASLLPNPYNLSSSMVALNGSLFQPFTGFTVSICAFKRIVGFKKLKCSFFS